MNLLYDGTFQKDIQEVRKLEIEIWKIFSIKYFQDKAAHFELMEKSDFIFYNVTDGLKALDIIRLKIYDPNLPINVKNVSLR